MSINPLQPKPARGRRTDVIIVGGGQAGLATAAVLSEAGIEHVVFERNAIAQRWLSERWDSLTLLTPNWMCRLPGCAYAGDDPEGFMTKNEAGAFLQQYALNKNIDVLTGMAVSRVTPMHGGYQVQVNDQAWWCRAVVDATGAFATAKVPAIGAQLPNDIHQLTAADYRNPQQLPGGSVLVVGASATGLQLAEEIHASGRPVTLAVGEHVRMPRTYRGRDIYWWLDRSGVLHETAADVDDIKRARRVPSPQLIGRAGCTLDLNRLQDQGIELVGRFAGVNGKQAQFSGGLANHLKSADLKLRRLLERFDESPVGMECTVPMQRPQPTELPAQPRLNIDLYSGEIRTVFWATGFTPDHSWLEMPVFDRKGKLDHDEGIVRSSPGLYTLGHTFMRSRKSSFIYGLADDVHHIVSDLRRHLGCATDSYSERAAV